MNYDNEKFAMIDDFVCEKNQAPLIDYFIIFKGEDTKIIVWYICARVITERQRIFIWTVHIFVFIFFWSISAVRNPKSFNLIG